MYKKIIAAIIAIAAAFVLAACGSSDSKSVRLAEEAPEGAAAEAAAEDAGNETLNDDAVKTADGNAEKEKEAEPETEAVKVPEGVEAPEEWLAEEWKGVIAADGDGLNLRSGPDSVYEEIDLVPDDTEVTILAEKDGWGFTSYRDQYGWVSLEWINK